MAEDEIERLLREVNASTSQAGAPAPRDAAATPARAEDKPAGGGRLAFAVGSGAVLGIGGFLFAVFTPFTDAPSMGFAAAGAAFITALVAGPPRWFSS